MRLSDELSDVAPNIDLAEVTRRLGIAPIRSWPAGELLSRGGSSVGRERLGSGD